MEINSDKFISPAPPLTDFEKELLTITMEECAEVAQRASKLIRFGNDTQSGRPFDNVGRLSMEVGDLQQMLKILERQGFIDAGIVEAQMPIKELSLTRYMQN